MSEPFQATVTTWLVALLPSLPFLITYLAYRRVLYGKRLTVLQVMARNGVLESYLSVFRRTTQTGTTDTAQQIIQELFNLYYHWRSYCLGICLNVAITVIAVACTLAHYGMPLGLPPKLATLAAATPTGVSLGFAGAYIWNLYDLIKRFRATDLTPAAFQFSWIRLLAACIVGPLAATAAADGAKPLIAFGFGLLPLQTIFDYFTDYAGKRLGITNTKMQAAGPTLHNLQGMTDDMISRMGEESIDSTESLAYADPMKLFLKTDIEWVVIIDIIDQSLLFNYIDSHLEALRPMGIRGAIEMAVIWDRFLAGGQETIEANKLIGAIATALGSPNDSTQATNLVRTMWEDDQVNLMWSLFGESFDSEALPPHDAEPRAATAAAH